MLTGMATAGLSPEMPPDTALVQLTLPVAPIVTESVWDTPLAAVCNTPVCAEFKRTVKLFEAPALTV